MFMVVQLRWRSNSKILLLHRYWIYRTEAGARRRVWLCKHSKTNIEVHYFNLNKEGEE